MHRNVVIILFFLFPLLSFSQQNAIVYGIVRDAKNNTLPFVNIVITGEKEGVISDKNGKYELSISSETKVIIAFSFIGFKTFQQEFMLMPGKREEFNVILEPSTIDIREISIEDVQLRSTTLKRIDPRTISSLPTISGGVEAILKTLPGVASGNELSSQYSVRGGNFDENLVYVNDIEVYRSFLIRSGQQEGLSFVNSDLVSSILFSAGGFEAVYGDKMSSVLDIKYKKPDKFAGSVNYGLLGGSTHLEGGSQDHRFTYLFGLRQKSTRYILNTLDSKGDYKPSFTDFQTYFTYDVTSELELSLLAHYSGNKYLYIPETRETQFGTVSEAYRFKVYFDGQEVDKYNTYLTGITAVHRPNKNLSLKWITSAFRTNESETYDVQGQYWIDQIETDFGDSSFGEVAYNKGVGTYFNHARNYLNATVSNLEHRGWYNLGRHFFQWSTKYQHEEIDDKLNEWIMNDSAGYSLPNSSDSLLFVQEVIKNQISLSSNRYSSFIQHSWTINDVNSILLTTGFRASYWDYNDDITVSPRATFSFKPRWEKDIVFRLSAGYYHQPPFYREMRDFYGNTYSNVKAQESIHFVTGADINLRIWKRPFKYVTEVYYKMLNHMIPYEIDNLRIRYLPQYTSHGYAAGIDMRINGEFVEGIESWVSLSIMQTQEDIDGDYYYEYFNKSGEKIIAGFTTDNIAADSVRHEPGYIPRPTDQRVTAGIFFQDYLPKFPTYKVHLNLLFGSRIPFGPPDHNRYKDTLRIPPYRRVDIGFSKQIYGKKGSESKDWHKHFESIWVTLEIYNLFQVPNVASYIWVKDINNRQYAVPNYLTGRQLNGRLIVKF